MPINIALGNGQQIMSPSSSHNDDAQPHLLQRPQTAPGSTEMFRPQSALDIPELSRDSLRNMLRSVGI